MLNSLQTSRSMLPIVNVAAMFAVLSTTQSLAFAQPAKPVRVGIIGLDNYQAVAYTQLFNAPKAKVDRAGLRVVAAFAGAASDDIPESVDNLPKWKKAMADFDVKPTATVEELLGSCDAVMIMSVDGRKHLEQARTVLKAGKRLY